MTAGDTESVLETARLRLRRLTLDDADALHAVLGDPVAMAHDPKPLGLRDGGGGGGEGLRVLEGGPQAGDLLDDRRERGFAPGGGEDRPADREGDRERFGGAQVVYVLDRPEVRSSG